MSARCCRTRLCGRPIYRTFYCRWHCAANTTALWVLEKYGPETVLFLMAADHVIENQATLQQATAAAARAAQAGHIVSFGVHPTRPETVYGYIKAGSALGKDADGAFRIAEFVEKPPLEQAEAYLAAGGYFWNGGIFVFRADTFLAEMQCFEPEMKTCCVAALKTAVDDIDFVRLDQTAFSEARDESIDYAIMEKTDKAVLESIEVQSGAYLGKDDIVRFDDVYGRAPADTRPTEPAPES